MNELTSQIKKLTSLDKLYQFADNHIQELHADVNLLHELKNKRRELKRVEWLHFEALQYQS